MSNQLFDVVIIGAGPGGISAAARASQRGVSHILLEMSDKHANTIQQYQKGKHVMAEPNKLPLRSDIEFEAGGREIILNNWKEAISTTEINIQYQAEVTSIEGDKNNFHIVLKSGDTFKAKNIVLSLGVQGNPRKLNVPGEDDLMVQAVLESADHYENETIVIVGAGDSAIENAIALSRHNRVILIDRSAGFSRAKEANRNQILKAIENEQIECFDSTTIDRIQRNSPGCPFPGRIILNTSDGLISIECHRVIARLGSNPPRKFVESIGIRFLSEELNSFPELSLHYESNVPGVYLIGALAGYPLIKQALNQGYEVIEHILGHSVQPSDHTALQKKLKNLPFFGNDVEDTLTLIQQRARLLRDINPLNLRELVMDSNILKPGLREEICTQGSYSSTFFNILQGEVQVRIEQGNPVSLEIGHFFGELSLISGRPREVTVIAGENCILLETPIRAIKKLIRMEESVRLGIDQVSIFRTISKYLDSYTPMEIIRSISNQVEIHRFAAGEILFREGDPYGRLFLVRKGSVTLSKKTGDDDVVVAYCAVGSIVGLIGFANKNLRMVTAQATVATEVLSMDHASFDKLLKNNPKLRRKVEQETQKQLAQYLRMQTEPERGETLSFLMAHGIGEATNVLIIDESLCVGCDNCETACAETHQNISRLDRKAGPSFYSLHVPISCRHCEHPHCMQDCPPDAIHRLESGEVYINNDTCIGCGNCEENCPYDVIKMAEISPKASFLKKLFSNKPSAVAPKIAVKCDMCKDLKGGSACVNACPTGAAIRIHAEEVVSLVNERIS